MYQKASKFLASVSTGTVLLLILLACGAHVLVHIHVPISRKVVGKSASPSTKGIVGGFEFIVLQRNLKEWHERPWIYVCEC